MEAAALALAGSATALATGLGALPVSHLGERAESLRPGLWGLTVGLMTVASVVGLLMPALDDGSVGTVGAGLALGVAFLLVSRRLLEARDIHVGRLRGAGVRRSMLVFAVLLLHSLPEGFAIGTAFASDEEGLGLFVILAIGLQNIPEGTSVAIPMEAAGFPPRQQFWAAVLTSAPQPVGALDRLRARSGDRGPPAAVVRVCGGSDAQPGRCRARARGLQAAGAPTRDRGHGRGRPPDDRARGAARGLGDLGVRLNAGRAFDVARRQGRRDTGPGTLGSS